MKKLAIYARQSRIKETNGSIEDQIFIGKKKAESLNLLYEIYIDKGKTATKDNFDNRPEFMRLLKDVEAGLIQAVSVLDVSRLTRNQLTQYQIKQIFMKFNVVIHSYIEGVIDYKDTGQELLQDFLAMMNNKQVRDTTIKIKNVLKHRAEQGKAHHGAFKPYGYMAEGIDKKLSVNPEEEDTIKRIFSLCLSGYGTAKIATVLNDAGIETRGHKSLKNGRILRNKYTHEEYHIPTDKIKWRPNTILRILQNPIYKGERIYLGEVVPAPAIIDPLTWDKVQQQLKKNTNRSGLQKHKYLLKGLCFCGRCGRNFVGRTRESKRDHYYYCASKIGGDSCGIRSLNIDYLEEVIWYAVISSNTVTDMVLQEINKIQNPEYIQELEQDAQRYKYEISQLKSERARLITLFTKELITTEEFEKRNDDYTVNNEELIRQNEIVLLKLHNHSQLKAQIDEIVEFQRQLKDLSTNASFELKSLLVRQYIESITINYFDDSENYEIVLLIRLPDPFNDRIYFEQHAFYLKKGEKPNLLNYDPSYDKYYLDQLEREFNQPPITTPQDR